MMTSTRGPYKIAIYGAGDAGCILIREASRMAEFEVVGALVFSEKKDGLDVGTLAGIHPLGVETTRNLAKFMAIDCDAVVHLGVDAPQVDAQGQFVALLEAGKNVVTSHPYSYLPARKAEFGSAIKEACRRGQATFCAAGLNPDLMTQRVLPILTGLSNGVTEIKLEEYFDCQDQTNRPNLEVIGLGQSMADVAKEDGPALWYQRQYNYQMIQHLCHEFGIDHYQLGGKVECSPAPEDIQRPVMHIAKGDCASISYTSMAFLHDNDKDQKENPFISIKITYYFSPIMKPPQLGPDDVYIITIEGRPSSRMVLGMRPSYNLTHDATTTTHCEGVEPAPPAYHAFANTILQSVPITVESPPGFRSPDTPLIHWKKDQRTNVGKRYEEEE